MFIKTWGVVLVVSLSVLSSCAHTEQPKTLVVSPGPAATNAGPKWGTPFPDAKAEATVAQTLQAFAEGGPSTRERYDEIVFMGPALWGSLRGLDPALEHIGTPSTAMIGKLQLEARVFLTDEAVTDLSQTQAMQGFGKMLRNATIRPANARERELFYRTIPFEIDGQPVTIVEEGKHRVVMFLKDGKLSWVDVLSEYQTNVPTAP